MALDEVFASVSSMKPEEAADLLRLSREYKVPVQDVAARPDYFKNGVVDPGDWQDLVARAPKTSSFLENPLQMAINQSPNRVRHLSELETYLNPLPSIKEGAKDIAVNTVMSAIGVVEAGRYGALGQIENPKPEVSNLEFATNPVTHDAYDYKMFDPSNGVKAKDLRQILKKEWLQPTEIKPADVPLGGAFQDFYRTAPQIAAQYALSMATAGLGTAGSLAVGTAFMGSQIAGGQYKELTESGVDPERAWKAATTNAALQAPLEAITIEGIAKGHLKNWIKTKFPTQAGKALTIETAAIAGLSEFITETVQKYPEAAAEIWAKHEGATPREQFALFMDDFWKITREGLYEGSLAAPFGVFGGAVNAHYSRKAAEKNIQLHVDRLGAIATEIQRRDLLSHSPESVRDFVDHVTGGEVVYVEPAALNQLYQSNSILSQEEINALLGITPEQVQTATETGEMVAVPVASYVTAVAEKPEIHAALKEHLAAEVDEGITLARVNKRNEEDVAKAQASVKQYNEELKAELEKTKTNLAAAATGLKGVPKDSINRIVDLLEKRAWAAYDNGQVASPTEWVKSNQLQFNRAFGNAEEARAWVPAGLVEGVDYAVMNQNGRAVVSFLSGKGIAEASQKGPLNTGPDTPSVPPVGGSTPVSLTELEQAFADRAVSAVMQAERMLPSNDVDVILGENPELYSIHNIQKWKVDVAKWMKKNGKSKQEIADHLNAVDKQLAIFSALGKFEVEVFPHTVDQKNNNPIRSNSDPIYKLSFDLSAMCVKRLSAQATRVYIEEQLGRPMSAPELTAMVAMFKIAGKPAPCLYCYVEAPRAKANEFLQTAYDLAFNTEDPPSGWGKESLEMLAAARTEVKEKGLTEAEFRIINDPAYGVTEAAAEERASKPALYAFLAKQYNNAKSNLPKLYAEYAGQILGVDQEVLDEIQNYAGFRYFSSSDFQYEHVVDLMQSFLDMQLRGMKSHSYTKVWEYAKIFGKTGQKIQLSVFAKKDAQGNIVQDTWQGMDWEKARELRAASKDTGTILVATSDEIIQWGLEQPWIDYVIPFHLSGIPKEYAEDMQWVNYTGTQAETSLDHDTKAAKIRMHEMGTEKGISDEKGTRAYLELALKRRLMPVFPQFLFKDYDPNKQVMNKRGTEALSNQEKARLDVAKNRWREMVEKGQIDWHQINPAYFKLKKDYARTDTPFRPVQAKFDMPTVKQVLAKLLTDDGVAKAVVETEIADKLIPLIEEYKESGRDIGLDMLREARMLDDTDSIALQLKEKHEVYNTDEEALRYATEALAQTARVEETADVQSQQGVLDRGQQQGDSRDQKREVSTGRGIATTVGYGITPELVSKGTVSLLGKTIRSSRELAVKAQALRHPGYETLHVIYTRQGQVVHHEALSCRLPGQVKFDYNDGLHPVLHMDDILTSLGADGWYFLHNHPSGRPVPSPEDVHITKFYGDMKTSSGSTNNPVNRRFKGHVVINSTQFAVIDRAGRVTMEDLPTKILAKPDYFTPSKPHPALKTKITDPGDIAGMAKALQLDPDVSVVFVTDAQLVTRAVVEVQNSLFSKDSKTVERYLRMLTRAHNGANLLLSTTNKELYDSLAGYVERGFFVDVVHTDSEAGLRGAGINPGAYANENWMGLPTGQKAPVARVLEKNMADLYQSPIGFYSAVQRAIEAMDFKTMPAADLLNRITKTPGIKQEELDDLGLVDWLKGQDGKVTKEQVLAFVEQGGPKLEEVVRRNREREWNKVSDDFYYLNTYGTDSVTVQQNDAGTWDFLDEDEEILDTFGTAEEAKQFGQEWMKNRDESPDWDMEKPNDVPLHAGLQIPGGTNHREVILTMPGQIEPYKPDDIHFTSEGGGTAIAWARVNDRMVDGKKVLFVEEIQSKRHQEGKKRGYSKEATFVRPEDITLVSENEYSWDLDYEGEVARFYKSDYRGLSLEQVKEVVAMKHSRSLQAVDAVPDAPFKSTPAWSMLAFKRILRMAVEQGYDSVAWTPGEVQAERYDLSKQISSLAWSPYGDGTGLLYAEDHGKNKVISKVIKETELEENVGKDVAKKLIEQPTEDGMKMLQGLDLKVGGEGMKGFYDRILPAEVGKYIKKLDKDAKVGATNIGKQTYADVEPNIYGDYEDTTNATDTGADSVEVWAIPITDKIRESVMQGQPLYQDVRGAFAYQDGKAIITLFESSDVSTLLHEMVGHFFIHNLLRDTSAATAQDRKTLLDFIGMTPEEWAAENAAYESGQISDRYRAGMEKLASAVESYFYEGNAPSLATRGLFAKFKDWLTKTYKDISDIGVQISPEVRDVFDRLLAGQSEIAEMQRIESYHAKLPTEVLETLSPDDQDRYDRLVRGAREEAESILQARLLDHLTTNAKLARAEAKLQAEKTVAAEVDADPFYALLASIETEYKNDPRTTARRYLDTALPMDQEYDWDVRAQDAGYSSGAHLAATILEAPTRDQVIRTKVEAEMKTWADLYLDKGKLREAAREAMYSDGGRELLAVEQQILQEKLGKVLKDSQLRYEAKLAAEKAVTDAKEILAARPLKDALRVQTYVASERKAAENSASALAKGDVAEAFLWKQKQLLGHALVQESLNLRRETEKLEKYLKRQKGSKQEGWKSDDTDEDDLRSVTMRHFHAAAEILLRFGYKRSDYNPAMREENLAAYVARMTEENPDMVDIPEWIHGSDRVATPRELTIGELRDVAASIKNIKLMARAGRNADGFLAIHSEDFSGLGEAVALAVAEAEANAKDVQQDAMGEIKRPSGLARYQAGLKKPSQHLLHLDGYKDFGVWDRLLYHFVQSAQNLKSSLVAQVVDAIDAAYNSQGISKQQRQLDAHVKIAIPEWNTSVTKNTLRAIALNMGSKSNMERLLSAPPVGLPAGINWDEASVRKVLGKYLTESDLRLTQKLWDAINLLYDPYNAMVKRMTGRELPKVEAQPVVFELENGTQVQLRGGYYPLAQDPRESKIAEMRAEQKASEGFVGVMPYPNSGASKARAKKAAYAVDLRLDNMIGHITDVAQDIAFRPVMHDVNKIMRQDAIKEILRRKLGDAAYAQLGQWQKVIAKGRDAVAESSSPFDGLFNAIRQRTTIANLLLRPATVLQNAANPTLYGKAVQEFGEKDAFAAYLTYGWMGTADTPAYIPHALRGSQAAEDLRQMVYALSPMMRDKMENPDYSLREMHGLIKHENSLMNFEATQKVGIKLALSHEKVVDFGSRVLAFADQLTDIPMWLGAFEKGRRLGMDDAAAARLADTVIERSTGSGRTIDTSGMQRGSAAERLFSMFMTFMNTQYNRWAMEYNIALKEKDAMRLMSFVATKYLLFGFVSALASFKWPDEDDDPWKWFAKEVLAWPVGMFPVMGSAFKGVIDKALGYKTFGYSISPAERGITDILRLIQNAQSENKTLRENTELGMQVAAFLFRYPDQINDWLNNTYDIMIGEMEFQGTDIVRRRPKKER